MKNIEITYLLGCVALYLAFAASPVAVLYGDSSLPKHKDFGSVLRDPGQCVIL